MTVDDDDSMQTTYLAKAFNNEWKWGWQYAKTYLAKACRNEYK